MKRPSSKFRNTKNSPLRVLDRRHIPADVPTQIVTRQPRFSATRGEPVPERSELLSSTRIYPKFFNRFQVEAVDVEQLKLPHRKVRKYSTRQLAKLIASIRKFDFIVPILITDDCTVIAGVGRILAAKQLGLMTIPAIRISHLTPEEVRAFRLADNRISELGEWDEEQLAIEIKELSELRLDFNIEWTGFDTAEVDLIVDALDHRSEVDPADQEMALPAKPVSKRGDLFTLDDHRLFCGDATTVHAYATVMGAETATLVFQDPPYNVRVNGHVGGLGKVKPREFAMASGEMSEAEFIAFLTLVLSLIGACIVDGALIFTCIDWRH